MIAKWTAVFALLIAASPVIAAEFRLATFSADVTPPLGHACMAGGIPPAKEVIDPLFARGVVLLGPEAPLVFCAVDWCEIRNTAYAQWRAGLAAAAGTTTERVLLSTVHQHDTPVADIDAQALLDARGLRTALCDAAFNTEAWGRVASAIRLALPGAQPITHYGTGEADVQELASNRRVVDADGTVHFPRMSATPDAAVREAPIGLIDPKLKTLSFWNGDRAVAAMHVFAVHPMSYYGRGGVSADFPGIARARRQADDPGVFQIYFSGCSGDVVAGKYNDGNPANRPILADKLHAAMVAAWTSTERHPLEAATLRAVDLVLPLREQGGYTNAELTKTLDDPEASTFARNLAAMGLSWRAGHARAPIQVLAADFGAAQFLLLPAESFVGYQIFAQECAPNDFVFVSGYGESAPGYIPTAEAEQDGFIEMHDWCWVARGAHIPMKTAIRQALRATSP